MPEKIARIRPLVPPESTPLPTLERRLANLVRAYVKQRCPLTAQSVVRHLDWLLKHPECCSDSGQDFAYLRLRRHWLMLAAIDQQAAPRRV